MKKKTISIHNFDSDLHYRARIQALKEHTSFKDLVERLLKKYLDKIEKSHRGKEGKDG